MHPIIPWSLLGCCSNETPVKKQTVVSDSFSGAEDCNDSNSSILPLAFTS